MPADPTYQVLVAVTATGAVVDALDVADWSCTAHLAWAEADTADVTVPLPGRDRAGQLVRTSLRSIGLGMSTYSLVIVRERTALWAGPVVSLGWDTTGVKIGAAGPSWIFDRRIICAAGYETNPGNPAADLALALSPRDRVISLLTRAATGTGRTLPLTLPTMSGFTADEPIVYHGLDLRTAFEAVKDTVEGDAGPDVRLDAALTNDLATLSWGVSVGDPALGEANPRAVWDYPAVLVSGDRDESETATTAYTVGNTPRGYAGDEDPQRILSVASYAPASPGLVLERADRTSVSETNPTLLDASARSYLATYRTAAERLSLVAATADTPPYRSAWQLGDTATINVTGHPWLDDEVLTRRLVGLTLTPAAATLIVQGG
jgi:hypothetical protein